MRRSGAGVRRAARTLDKKILPIGGEEDHCKHTRQKIKINVKDKRKDKKQRGLHYITDWRRHTSDIKRGQMLKGMITQTRQRPKTFKAKWQCHLQGF